MKAMGMSKALKEATKRFGQNAACQVTPAGTKLVGKIMLGMLFQVIGSGPTWEAALDNAEFMRSTYKPKPPENNPNLPQGPKFLSLIWIAVALASTGCASVMGNVERREFHGQQEICWTPSQKWNGLAAVVASKIESMGVR